MKKRQVTHIDFSVRFNKQLEAAPREIKTAFVETLLFFKENKGHAALRNHSLTKTLSGYRSIDVTDDWRALYREEKGRIIFVQIGTHKQLYG